MVLKQISRLRFAPLGMTRGGVMVLLDLSDLSDGWFRGDHVGSPPTGGVAISYENVTLWRGCTKMSHLVLWAFNEKYP